MYNLGPKTFTTGAAVEAKRLVKLDGSGNVVHCTATSSDEPIGVTQYAADSGEDVAVDLLAEGRTFEMEAAGSISVTDDVFEAGSEPTESDRNFSGATYRSN